MIKTLSQWNFLPADPTKLCYLTLALSFVVRIAAGMVAPYFSGDWFMYSKVAENILRGCGVSASDPASGDCVPHFGGNGLPGYPAFLALLWRLFGPSHGPIIVAQAVFGALANGWLTWAAFRWSNSVRVAAVCGFLLSCSPVQIAWTGSGLTEALATAATSWLLAELLLSVVEKRLRIATTGVALSVAAFLRLDSAALIVPIAMTAMMLHRPWIAIQRLLLIAAIVAVPLGLWTARNVSLGVNIFPMFAIQPDGSSGPQGYFDWVSTWAVTEEQRANAVFYADKDYRRIKLPSTIYVNDAERLRVAGLLDELRSAEGKPFPPGADAAFELLARDRLAQESLQDKVSRPIRRILGIWAAWISPYEHALGIPAIQLSPTAIYRATLLAAFVLFLLRAGSRRFRDELQLAGIATAFIVGRTVLLVAAFAIETRYLVEIAPVFEVCSGVLIARARLPFGWRSQNVLVKP